MFWQCKCGARVFAHYPDCSFCGDPRPLVQHDPSPVKRFVKHNAPPPPKPPEPVAPEDPGYTYY